MDTSKTEVETAISPMLWGCKAIARTIGRTERATFHMLERRVIPARKVGKTWCADRDALLGFLRQGDAA